MILPDIGIGTGDRLKPRRSPVCVLFGDFLRGFLLGLDPLFPLAQGEFLATPGAVADGHVGKALGSGEGDAVFLEYGVVKQEAPFQGNGLP